MQKNAKMMPTNMPKNATHTAFYGRDHRLHFGLVGNVLWICRSFWLEEPRSESLDVSSVRRLTRRSRPGDVPAAAASRRSLRSRRSSTPPLPPPPLPLRRVDSFAATRQQAAINQPLVVELAPQVPDGLVAPNHLVVGVGIVANGRHPVKVFGAHRPLEMRLPSRMNPIAKIWVLLT